MVGFAFGDDGIVGFSGCRVSEINWGVVGKGWSKIFRC